MAVWFTVEGLNELKAELQRLPDDLKGEATQIVLESAAAAQAEIVAAYPMGPTGNLRNGVRMSVMNVGAHGVAAEVRSSAFHAWLYEHGTQARHTKLGVSRGIMPAPPAPVFIPTMMRHRRVMYAQLAAILRAQGLMVVGG